MTEFVLSCASVRGWGRWHRLAWLLLLLCAGGLAMPPEVNTGVTWTPDANSSRRDRSISQAWIEVVGRGLYVVVTDPHGRVESIADTGASCIPNFSMDSIPIHERPEQGFIYGTHIVLEPEPGRYDLRVASPESRLVHLVTRRTLMADCGAHDSMAVAAHDTVSWSIEYSPAAKTSAGPCWIRIRRPGSPGGRPDG